MVDFDSRGIVSQLIGLFVICQLMVHPVGSALIDAKVDVAVVVTAEKYSNGSVKTFSKEAYKNMSLYFEMGENKTRFAIVSAAEPVVDTAKVVLNFTGDQTHFLINLYNWNASSTSIWSDWNAVFRVARDLFKPIHHRRAKILYIIMPQTDNYASVETAKQLRDDGVWVHIVGCLGDPNLVVPCKDMSQNYTAKFERFRCYPDYSCQNSLHSIQNIDALSGMKGDICNAQPLCRYENDGKTCVGDVWRPYVINMNCSTANVTPPTACPAAECNKMCDHWWPGVKPTCNDTCGEVLTIKRAGDPPKKLEYCPRETNIECPPCTVKEEDDTFFVTVNLTIQVICLIAALALAVATFVLMG